MHSIQDFFKTIYSWLLYVVKNYPIIFIWLIGLFVFLVLNNHGYWIFDDYETVSKIVFSMIAWCLSSLFITINNRSKWISWVWNIILQLTPILIWLGIYYTWTRFGDQQMIWYSIAASIILLVIKVFLAYRKPSVWAENENNVWYYYSTLIWHIIVWLIYGITIMLGLFAIIKSVLYLFDIGSNHLWMADIAYFAFGIVAPFVFLSYTKFEAESYNIHKFVQLFAKYVLVSLLIVYAVVILVYVGKIVVTQERPKGILIYMIYWFAAIWLATLYILYPLRDTNPNYTKWQRIYWWLLVLFLIVGIFAIGIRVKEYGITAPRYVVILLLIRFFYIGLCALFPKYFHIQKNIFVLWLLGFLGIFAWPVNMYHTVLQSQLWRRESVLWSNNLLDENNMVIPWDHKEKVSTWDVAKLSSVVDYMIENYNPQIFANYISWYQQVAQNTEDYYTNQSNKMSIMNQIWLQYDDNYRYYSLSDKDFYMNNYIDYYVWESRNIDIWDKRIYKISLNNYMKSWRSHDKQTDEIKIDLEDNITCNLKWEDIIKKVFDLPKPIAPTEVWSDPVWNSANHITSPIQIEWVNCNLWIINISIEKKSDTENTITYLDGFITMN